MYSFFIFTFFRQHTLQRPGRRLFANGKEIPIDFLFYLIDKHVASGRTTIVAPYPTSDKPNESGYVWSGYSAERILEKVQFIYNSAIHEYIKMISSTFKKLRSSLTIAILSPCMIVGKLRIPEDSTTLTHLRQLTWYIKALPENEQTCVDILSDEIQSNILDLLNPLLQNNMAHRPDAEDREIARITSKCVDIYHSALVTKLVFSWLSDELKEIGWIE